MTLDANIKWIVNDSKLNIKVNQLETVIIEIECNNEHADECDVYEAIQDKLTWKYHFLPVAELEFEVLNLGDLLDAVTGLDDTLE